MSYQERVSACNFIDEQMIENDEDDGDMADKGSDNCYTRDTKRNA